MSTFGRQIVGTLDLNTTQLLADGHDADWKSGGGTIDWATITAANTETTLPDGSVIPAGVKFIRYGDTVAEITASGRFGPHRIADGTVPGPTDGRGTLEAGRCFVVNRTLREDEVASDHAAQLFDGGRIWEARLQVGGEGQPTLAQIKAAFPRLSYAR